MTYRQIVDEFTRHVLPGVREQYEQDKKPDYTARCEAFCNFTDALCKDGRITAEQDHNMQHPSCCLSPSERRARPE